MIEGRLTIKIEFNSLKFEIKELQIFRMNMTLVYSEWVTKNSLVINIPIGLYIVRLFLTSGDEFQEVVEIFDKQESNVLFAENEKKINSYYDEVVSCECSIEYLNYENLPSKREVRFSKNEEYLEIKKNGINGRLWHFQYNNWVPEVVPEIINEVIDEKGFIFSLNTSQQLQVLELKIPKMASHFVVLPVSSVLKCTIKLADGPEAIVNKFDVSIVIDDPRAQALLSLLNRGNIEKVKSLLAVKHAEDLLLHKITDPVKAAIGGYFLLKTESTDRMHNWANNLANWFSWMPDGAIIHAWQMILSDDGKNYTIEIRRRLLEATTNGIPIFTEGLRLLYEGLVMCSYQFEHKDIEIETALANVKLLVANADMSRETTTFIGIRPDNPGRDKNRKEKKLSIRSILQKIRNYFFK